MSPKELVAYAEKLGHINVTLLNRSRGGFVVVCDCGWQSTRRATQPEALRTAIHHLENAARIHLRDSRAAGVSVA